jgi:hypothetical protein
MAEAEYGVDCEEPMLPMVEALLASAEYNGAEPAVLAWLARVRDGLAIIEGDERTLH